MKNLSLRYLLIALCVTLAACDTFGPAADDSTAHRINSLLETDTDNSNDYNIDNNNLLDKRTERYAFGLGRRAYTYTSGGSGVKRLPVYNFGLGKRARPYSFGLGKRSDQNDDYGDVNGYDNLGLLGYADRYDNLKRGRSYNSELGGRNNLFDNEVGKKRTTTQRYNFGLGR